MLVLRIELVVQLDHVNILDLIPYFFFSYHFQDGHLHHTLFGISCLVLDHLDSYDLLCFDILALDDLTKCACTQYIQDHIPILPCQSIHLPIPTRQHLLVTLSTTQDIIDIQDIIKVFIVISIIGSRFTGLGKDATWIMACIVLESMVALLISQAQVSCHG